MTARKLVALSMATVLFAATACSGDEAPVNTDHPEGNITVRVYPMVGDKEDKAFWTKQAAAFEAKYPGTKVKIDVQPWKDRETALTTAITGGKAPDVVYMIPDELRLFQSQGALAPLDIDTKALRPNVVDAVTLDGKTYGAPLLMSVVPGICDKKAMKGAGIDTPPTTWDELLEAGAKAKEKGYYITTISATNGATLNTSFYPWLWQAGGDVFNKDGKLTIDSPAAVEAVGFMKKLTDAGYVNKNEAVQPVPNEQNSVGKRKVVCIYDQSIQTLKPVWGNDMVVTAPLKNKAQKTYGTVGSYVVLKGSKEQDVAHAWAKFASSAEVVKAVDQFMGYQSPRTDVDLGFKEGSLEKESEKYLEMTYTGAPAPQARAVQAAIAPQVQAVLLGQATPEEAMKKAQTNGEKLVK